MEVGALMLVRILLHTWNLYLDHLGKLLPYTNTFNDAADRLWNEEKH